MSKLEKKIIAVKLYAYITNSPFTVIVNKIIKGLINK